MSSGFQWTSKRSAAALSLAEGHTQVEVANQLGITDRVIRKWLAEQEFKEEVDRLSLMVGLASKAERMRMANRFVREQTRNGLSSEKDLLDWLKYAKSETDGLDLGLALEFAKLTQGLTLSRNEGTS